MSMSTFKIRPLPPPGSEPDSGNPTVRDRRGACGNVVHGGTRNLRPIPKGGLSELSAYRCVRRRPIPTTIFSSEKWKEFRRCHNCRENPMQSFLRCYR